MPDVVSPETRSRMMSGIRSKDTKPEILIRKELYKKGFRYRLHGKKLPGKPDIILKKHNALIFIHGCFWHKHDCHLFKWPKTRESFWKAKISGNVERDKRVAEGLISTKWRVCIIWECSLKGKTKLSLDTVLDKCVDWIGAEVQQLEIRGE